MGCRHQGGRFVGLGACGARGRPATFYDLIVLTRAATAGLITLLVASPNLFPDFLIPRSILLLDWGATIVFVGDSAMLRHFQETGGLGMRPSQNHVRAFIVGADEEGK